MNIPVTAQKRRDYLRIPGRLEVRTKTWTTLGGSPLYSYEDRMRAVKRYIPHGRSAAATIRELGYPSRESLDRWFQYYVTNGELNASFPSNSGFSQ